MSDKIQIIENLSIGFKSKSGNEVSILKDINCPLKYIIFNHAVAPFAINVSPITV